VEFYLKQKRAIALQMKRAGYGIDTQNNEQRDTMQIKIDFIAKSPCKLTKRKNWTLASCPVLDVHSQGETETQAKKNLAEALSLFLISCYERGTLDAVLKQA
jgi:predicted RNase H-like HicB family nuclease